MLTEEQKSKINWSPHENCALVNTETLSIFYGTDEGKKDCQSVLSRMTPAHPMYSKLEIVER